MHFSNTNYYTSSVSLVIVCTHYGIRGLAVTPPQVKTLHLIGLCRPPKANRDVISYTNNSERVHAPREAFLSASVQFTGLKL